MRIRLIHKQSCLLISAVVLAVVTMGALNAWNLRNGFAEFLFTRDVERLEQFASFVGEEAERAGNIDALTREGIDLRELLRRFAKAQVSSPGYPSVSTRPDIQAGSLSLPRPPPTDKANAFRERVAVYGLDGTALMGRGLQQVAGEGVLVERPVRVHGNTVATVRMSKLKPVQDDLEMKFLRSQYTSILVVAAMLLVCALAGARWIAGRWVRPLLEIQIATERISAGDFDFHLLETRTDEIGDVMRNVNRMAVELKELEGVRRKWIADISHELRTPLTVLRGEIDALFEGVRPMEAQALESLRQEALQLSALVDDLHLLSVSDLKGLPCYFEELDAAELLRKIIGRFTLRAHQLELELKFYIGGTCSSTVVRWDSQRMGQLMGNLLDNSLRYTDSPGRIAVRLEMNPSHIVIEFEDSSPGVHNADLPRLFEPLYRSDAARSRHSGGSGLGLAICAAIVQAHKGSISARASVLGGMQIRIELPRFLGTSK